MKPPPISTELPTTLDECYAMIRRLLDENAALRRSGAAFGGLAERLNTQLQQERRRRDREPHDETERPAGAPWIADNDELTG